MSKKNIIFIIFGLLLSSIVFFFDYKETFEPKELYRVYLEGKTIGFIESKEKLEEYIDSGQQEIKEKYKVDKVYIPNDLDIIRETTYNEKISPEDTLYTTIKDNSYFTINGYVVKIKGVEVSNEDGKEQEEDKILYILDKTLFEKSLQNTILAFTTESEYNNFINKTQPEIKETGKLIEDMYIKNDITIKQDKISTKSNILVTEEEISKYLLFGTKEEQDKYTVKDGDDIDTILDKNKLSLQEFLIANPQFNSVNNLLYKGQIINIGLIKPAIRFVEESHIVEVQTKKYDTKIEYDGDLLAGVEKVKQKGVNGADKVTTKIQMTNGDVTSAVIASTEEIKPAVTEIIIKGNKKAAIGNLGVWFWPTNKPYIVMSTYGWRWGKFHEGIDISGTGYGSPIYAANNGVVTVSRFDSYNGNYIIINHNNGYYSLYAHMASLNVSAGQVVSMGDKIGSMGSTGYAFGTHLHFSIYKGVPFANGTSSINPYSVY